MGSQSPGTRHTRPSGPSLSMASLWETHNGTSTFARSIRFDATLRKLVAAMSSSNTMRTAGGVPWSSAGLWEE